MRFHIYYSTQFIASLAWLSAEIVGRFRRKSEEASTWREVGCECEKKLKL